MLKIQLVIEKTTLKMYSYSFPQLTHYIVMIDTFFKTVYSSIKLNKTHC